MMRPRVYRNNWDMFDDFFNDPFWGGASHVGQMSTDIRDCGEHYQVDIELPGFSKEDVKAELKNGYLTVSASHSEEKEDKSHRYIRQERCLGSCQRSFYVGEGVTQEDITAKFTDGVLALSIPKKEAKPEVEESKYISIEG